VVPVFSTNKPDRHNIIQILLKVAISTITPDPQTLHYPMNILVMFAFTRSSDFGEDPKEIN
jgi:hypothetical protein